MSFANLENIEQQKKRANSAKLLQKMTAFKVLNN